MEDKTVLYVEDNYHNRRIVRKILSTRGYNVVEAEDGLVGYEMICELKPPLVLLDIALPHLDGIQIVQRLKADKETRHIPVVALTASAMRGDRERFLEAGCDDYLSKPVRSFELIEMVERYYQPSNETSESKIEEPPKLDENTAEDLDHHRGHTDIIENGEAVEHMASKEEEPSAAISPVTEPPKKKRKPAAKKKLAAVKKKKLKVSRKKTAKPKKEAALAAVEDHALKKVAIVNETETAWERKVVEMLSSVAIQPPTPQVSPAGEVISQPLIEQNVSEMLADIPTLPSTPEAETATEPLPELNTILPALDSAEEEAQPEPAVVEIDHDPEPVVGDYIWVIEPDATISRLVRRLLAAKLKIEAVEMTLGDLPSQPKTLPSLLILGTKRVDQQLQETLQGVRSVAGMSAVPFIVLTNENPDAEQLSEYAPEAGLVWLKEQLVNDNLLARVGDLMNSKPDQPQPEGTAHYNATSDGDARTTVLVIEDVSDSAALAEKILANNNYIPIVAETGERGVTLAKDVHPDLILLDLGLPDVDGQTLIGILRADPDLSDVPVILCTAWPKETLEKMVEAYGFDGYISKPYKVAEFMGVVEEHTA